MRLIASSSKGGMIIWSGVIPFACSFLLFSYFIFFFPSFSYIIWSGVNLFACSFLLFSYFFFLILFILILYMRMKERKKWNSWMIKMNKQKHWPISLYIYNKLVVCESDITIFVQIRLTEEWSCFSRMMLWWSVGSASTVVLIQCISNVKMNCMWL